MKEVSERGLFLWRRTHTSLSFSPNWNWCVHLQRKRPLPKEQTQTSYGVATISRLLKSIGLFGEYRSLLQVSFAKETYNFKEPANRSHPIELLQSPLAAKLATYTDCRAEFREFVLMAIFLSALRRRLSTRVCDRVTYVGDNPQSRHTHIYIHVCVYVCIYIYKYVCIYIYVYMNTHMCVQP